MNRDEIEKGKWCSQSGFLDINGKCRSPDGCFCKSMADALAQLANAKAAQAMVVERAAELCDRVAAGYEKAGDAAIGCGVRLTGANIRALAPADGLALVEALRAEIADLKLNMDADLQTMIREGAALKKAIADRDRLSAANAALEAQVGALRLQLDQKDALYDSGFQAGVKLGWNFGVSGDEAGFQAATSSTEHVAELKRIRAALAEVQADARQEGGE